MAEKFRDNSSKARGGEDDARAELAGNWAQMAASMVSPNAGAGGGGRKGSKNGGGPAPLPVSALPVPEDDPAPEQQSKHLDLPRNAKGELTPAQRARLGLDLDPSSHDPAAQSAAQALEAPPAGQPLQPPSQQSAPRAQPPIAAVPEPTGEPAGENFPAASGEIQQQPGSEFDFRAMELEPNAIEPDVPALQPVENDAPRLAPVSKSEPRLAPARERTAPSERTTRNHAPDTSAKRGGTSRRESEDGFEHVTRDRNVLSYGVAWTAFCVVITGVLSFTSNMSGDPTASAGPGPLIPGLLSIALGWIVVIAARGLGNGWWSLMVLPAVVLIVGPYVYKNVWAGSVEDAARSYLSQAGAAIQIDVDATSVVSATKNTSRGCFAINRTRKNYDTEIAVVTFQPETSRQQADYSLAPRYAGRIETGGERSTYRVFTFRGGRAPAIVTTPAAPPLDCANSTSTPGTGGKRLEEG
ncbi:MAG: hypothetical protein HY827_04945 [Actinobacteria bacterium]|nr:hypothetical protein [Actinomycetota bacterium]